PNARWIHDALRFYMEFHKQAEGLDGCIVNDVLPIALLLRPDVLTFEDRNLAVGLDDGDHRGHTRVKPDGARVRVATRVDLSRARALVALGRATQGIVERGLLELQQGRSLLHAVQDADWVMEAINEDLVAKQRLFHAIEDVAGPEALVTSSSSGIPPTELFAR